MVTHRRLIRTAVAGITAAGLVTTLAVAGSGASALAATSAPAASVTAAAMPTCSLGHGPIGLTVLAPTAGAVITGDSLQIHVKAKGYTLDARYAGTPNLPTVGHYHEILDGKLVDMTPATDPEHDTISMVGVTPGPHTLTLVPACNDHSMVMAKAVSVTFTYAGPALPMPAPAASTGIPTIAITSPANGATMTAGSTVDFTAKVTDFTLCADCFGKADVAGVGHWHIFVDAPVMSNMKTMAGSATQSVSLKGIRPGWHTFWAVLVNDGHMPLMGQPMSMTAVYLYVAPTH